MKDVRSLSKQIEDLERTAASRLGEDRAGMTAAECAQMWHLAVKLQKQIQALPVGEVERFNLAALMMAGSPSSALHDTPRGTEYVPASDYDSLLAKYNALLSEKASDLEAWREIAPWFELTDASFTGRAPVPSLYFCVASWQAQEKCPLAYEKIKQAQGDR